jgi:hypothetical protein
VRESARFMSASLSCSRHQGTHRSVRPFLAWCFHSVRAPRAQKPAISRSPPVGHSPDLQSFTHWSVFSLSCALIVPRLAACTHRFQSPGSVFPFCTSRWTEHILLNSSSKYLIFPVSNPAHCASVFAFVSDSCLCSAGNSERREVARFPFF